MPNSTDQTMDDDIPPHPEELKTTYSFRVGNAISFKSSARITPAGIVTIGVTVGLVALAVAWLSPRRRGF
jgi:hypothetical protein